MQYPYSNPINEAIKTFSAVDNIYQNKREDVIREEDRAFNRSMAIKQDERANKADQRADNADKRAINDAAYVQGVRSREEQARELNAQRVDPAAAYLDPEMRATHRPLLSEANQRIGAGDFDSNFFMPYLRTLYKDQINKGTGGEDKQLEKVGLAPDGQSLMFGISLKDKDGNQKYKLVTEKRGTVEEGDVNPKTIPIQTFIKDNFMRQVIIDEYDKHQIDRNSPPEAVASANIAIDKKLVALGDPNAMKRQEYRQAGSQAEKFKATYPTTLTPEEVQQRLTRDLLTAGTDPAIVKAYVDTYAAPESAGWKNVDAGGRQWAIDEKDPTKRTDLGPSPSALKNASDAALAGTKEKGEKNLDGRQITSKDGKLKVSVSELKTLYETNYGKKDPVTGFSFLDGSEPITFEQFANNWADSPVFVESVNTTALMAQADTQAREWADEKESDLIPFNSHSSTEISAKRQEIFDSLKAQEEKRISGATKQTGAAIPDEGTTKKTLDRTTAAALLKEAGGNKDKARQLATQRGYAL